LACSVVGFLHDGPSVSILTRHRAMVIICTAVFNVQFCVPSGNALHFDLSKPGSNLGQDSHYSVYSRDFYQSLHHLKLGHDLFLPH
jgi:hypothetical protein